MTEGEEWPSVSALECRCGASGDELCKRKRGSWFGLGPLKADPCDHFPLRKGVFALSAPNISGAEREQAS